MKCFICAKRALFPDGDDKVVLMIAISPTLGASITSHNEGFITLEAKAFWDDVWIAHRHCWDVLYGMGSWLPCGESDKKTRRVGGPGDLEHED